MVKAAPKATRKVTAAPRRSGSAASRGGGLAGKKTRGWGGGEGGAGDLSKWYGANRKLWLPSGLWTSDDVPDYLNGSLAGDYGWDPLGLGQDPAQVAKYRSNEILHARWAMLGAAGAIIPEGLAANGADLPGANWAQTGAVMLNGDNLNWTPAPFGIYENPLPLVVADDPDLFAELKVKEIKNGRLAMVSILGFAVATLYTGAGPFENWQNHLADPFAQNLYSTLGGGAARAAAINTL